MNLNLGKGATKDLFHNDRSPRIKIKFHPNIPFVKKTGWIVFTHKICQRHKWNNDILSKNGNR